MHTNANVCFVVLLGLIAGCVEKPLSEPKPSEADKLLYGRWMAKQANDDDMLVEFAPPAGSTPKTELSDQKLMVMSQYKRTKEGRIYARTDRRAFITAARGKTFLNAYTEKSKGAVPCPPREFDIPAWFDVNLYKLDQDTLDVWTMDQPPLVQAVRKGQLRGSVIRIPEDDPNSEGVRLEGGQLLLDFLTGKDGGNVFPDSKKVRLTRVKDK